MLRNETRCSCDASRWEGDLRAQPPRPLRRWHLQGGSSPAEHQDHPRGSESYPRWANKARGHVGDLAGWAHEKEGQTESRQPEGILETGSLPRLQDHVTAREFGLLGVGCATFSGNQPNSQIWVIFNLTRAVEYLVIPLDIGRAVFLL